MARRGAARAGRCVERDIAHFEIGGGGETVVVHGGVNIVDSQYRTFFDVSSDGGQTWQVRNGPAGFELPRANNYFDATDATHWALTSGPELRVTDDGGSTWQTRPDFPLAKNGNLMFPLRFPTPDVGWIRTFSGRILRTTDGARSWSDVTNGGIPRALVNATPAHAAAVEPGGFIGCPTRPLTPPPSGNPPVGLVDAAKEYMRSTGQDAAQTVEHVYRVGQNPKDSFGSLFTVQLSSCGDALIADAWVVELTGPPGGRVRSTRRNSRSRTTPTVGTSSAATTDQPRSGVDISTERVDLHAGTQVRV